MTFAQKFTRIIDRFYIKPLHRIISKQTFRYGVCGVLNSFVIEPVLFYIVYHYILRERFTDLGFVVVSPHVASLVIITPVIFFVGFWFNRYITFSTSPLKGGTQLARYALALVGAFLINYVCLKLFVEVLHIYPTPSKMLATVVCVVYSFLAQKYYSFKGATKD